MDILKKINKLRLERKWSVYRLSVESGIPQSTLTNMFNRETLPSITTLECICRAFGISVSEFFEENTPSEIIDEKELMTLYRSLSIKEQKTGADLVRYMSSK